MILILAIAVLFGFLAINIWTIFDSGKVSRDLKARNELEVTSGDLTVKHLEILEALIRKSGGMEDIQEDCYDINMGKVISKCFESGNTIIENYHLPKEEEFNDLVELSYIDYDESTGVYSITSLGESLLELIEITSG